MYLRLAGSSPTYTGTSKSMRALMLASNSSRVTSSSCSVSDEEEEQLELSYSWERPPSEAEMLWALLAEPSESYS